MSRPLLISDCDEVLLHMVSHFNDWLGEEHDIDFAFESGEFDGAMTSRETSEPVPRESSAAVAARGPSGSSAPGRTGSMRSQTVPSQPLPKPRTASSIGSPWPSR